MREVASEENHKWDEEEMLKVPRSSMLKT